MEQNYLWHFVDKNNKSAGGLHVIYTTDDKVMDRLDEYFDENPHDIYVSRYKKDELRVKLYKISIDEQWLVCDDKFDEDDAEWNENCNED